MLDRLITFALQQRVFILALALALAISGWYAWRNLPVEAFPDVQDVQVQIVKNGRFRFLGVVSDPDVITP